MKLKALYIFLIVIIGFEALASKPPKRRPRLLLKINQIIENTAQRDFLTSSSCKPLTLIKENQPKQAWECAKKLKHPQMIKAAKWSYYLANGSASFEELISFIKNNPDFPDQDKLMAIAEQKINNNTNIRILTNWCSTNSPQTGNAAAHCLEVLPNIKNNKIESCVRLAWAKQSFSQEGERAFYLKYRNILDEQDHINRLNYMLSKTHKLSNLPLNELSEDHQNLFKVKLRAITDRSDEDGNLFKTIARHLKNDPHLLYLRAQWYVLSKDKDGLAAFLIRYSNVKDTQTDQWFKIRSLLVWDLLEAKKYEIAYRIAAANNYKDPSNYVDGEWLAGKIAYFNLEDPSLAYGHFQNILNNSRYSISRAKGAYWSGMAAKALGQDDLSKKYFNAATRYIDTFYGQLALMQLSGGKGMHIALPAIPTITDQDVQWFKNNELLIISHIFSYAGRDSPTRKFIRAALATADTSGKKYLIAKFGKHVDIHLFSTISGKEVARGGDLFIEYSYPVLALDPKKIPIEKALVHSIIRQESEFNPNAKSIAGATGLMQLMQPTAKDIAYKTKQQLTEGSLRNVNMNIFLGSSHLGQIIDRYKGSYLLAIAAYNAGEGNVNKWIKKNGDPRKFQTMDQVVEWIENIPFVETRGYVQYIMSNLQIYRNLLTNGGKTSLRKLHIDLGQDLV